MQFKPMSLGEFERRYGVNRGTVKRRANELGHDTAAGLSAAAVADLYSDMGLGTPAVVEVEASPPPAPAAGALAIADPFSGVAPGAWGTSRLMVVDRSHGANAIAQDAAALLAAAAAANNEAAIAAAGAADQLGDQLGALLAQRTISASERRRQSLLNDYLTTQGVVVGESPTAGA